tara:strand:- start:161 stop:817 length:657 start_codon:yes stop_codon:yes gene_type:complete
MPSTAGKGFGSESSTPDYKTLFEQVADKTGGEQQSLSWYKNTLHSLAQIYKESPDKIISDERRDATNDPHEQDGNKLRTTVKQGHLYFFEYKAKSKWLPYYDKFPLAYVFKAHQGGFYAANLHYLKPKSRLKAILKLERGLIDIPKKIIHKYLSDHVESLYLDLASEEWETSILIPVEDFVMTKGSGRIPYDRELVWEEMTYYEKDRVKAKAIVKDYI